MSFYIFHRHRVCLVDLVDLICSLYSWWEGFGSSVLAILPLSFTCGFISTCACGSSSGGLFLRLPWRICVCLSEAQVWKWCSFSGCRSSGSTRYSGELVARVVGNIVLYKGMATSIGKYIPVILSGELPSLTEKPGRPQFSSVQLLSHVRLLETPQTAARQTSLSITNSQSPPKPMSTDAVMTSNHLNLSRPLFLLPSIFLSIRIFSNVSDLRIRWRKYWSFRFKISPTNEDPGLISFRMGWLDLLAVKGLSRVFSNTTVQNHQYFGTQLSLKSNSHIHTWLLDKP